MSSIRDALKRAQAERSERLSAQEAEQKSAVEQARPAELADMHLMDTKLLRTPEVPVEFTEEFAIFRQAVETALPRTRRSIVMTSATANSGVSTIALYAATSLAIRDGKTTCLIDGNFKSPSISQRFGLLGGPGLSDYCLHSMELTEVMHRTECPELYVMSVGTEIHNPSLVLSRDRAKTLASDLSQRFDYVIFDASAVLSTAESSLLAANVDGVVLVAHASRTKREVLAKAEKLIRFSGGRVLGVILNRRQYPIPDAIYKRL